VERPLASILLALAVAVGAAPAAADEPAKEPVHAAEADADPDAGALRPAPADDRKGHLYFGAHGIVMGPAGAMGPNTPSTTLAVVGYGVGGFLGVGLGRQVTFQALGDWTRLFSPGSCSATCGGQTYSVGLGLTYHVTQALGFDPWVSYGIGYRRTSFNLVTPANPHGMVYQGIDVARLAIGGDFYPAPFFGFGPWLGVDLGTNFRRANPLETLPPDVHDGPRTYALFQAGLRIAFDPMRRPVSRGAREARGPLSHGF